MLLLLLLKVLLLLSWAFHKPAMHKLESISSSLQLLLGAPLQCCAGRTRKAGG